MSLFPSRWPAKFPDRIQLYTFPTPNGQKASIALEELELPYEAHRIHIGKGDQFDPEFIAINPNSKIPAIIDPNDGDPIPIMESGAILMHLAQKTGRLLPEHPTARSRAIQWVFFQVGSIGPMLGQLGHFHGAHQKRGDQSYGVERYANETKRLLQVLDDALAGQDWIAGEFSIADIAIVPWLNGLDYYKLKPHLGFADYKHVVAWSDRFNARPAVQRGARVG